MKSIFETLNQLQKQHFNTPSSFDREDASIFIDSLIDTLFPIRSRKKMSWESIHSQLQALIGMEKTEVFFQKLPQIYTHLMEDAHMINRYDPASTGVEEVILCYLGFYAVAVYRVCHQLHLLNIPILPRIISEYAHSITGIDIHPAAQIGKSFFIDHGTGIVIGATCIIGNHVKIYQGVTLGALNVKKSLAKIKRHPTIEDHVTIYANATILGGNTTVGHHSIIGGNVWLTKSIEPYTIVQHQGDIIIKRPSNSGSIDFVI